MYIPFFFISEFFHRAQEFLSDSDASLVFESKGAKIASHVATGFHTDEKGQPRLPGL